VTIELLVATLLAAAPQPAARAADDPPEVRAVWVDAFHAGIRSPGEAADLVAAARRANLNTLIVQVRRRGDALYLKGVEPPLDDPAYDPSFDALAHVVEAAHAAGLEVHAWVNAMPVWRGDTPPRDPRHVFNRHGPAARGDENWFTASPAGEHRFPVGYFLDPGHPAAAAYLAGIYVDLVRNYAVDGIHFDYIRYPETDEQLPRGAGVGYNAVSLARFRRATGRTDTPAPADEEWMAWRRTQVTQLVRRVAIEAKAVNPRVTISAALIPWGQAPKGEQDFADVAPMQRIYQDWHGWLHEGLLDLAVPMNYASETNDRVRGWFDDWIRWEKRHGHGRQVAVGLGAYRNTPADTLAQLARVRRTDGKHSVAGVSFFSYAVPQRPPEVQPGVEPPSALDREATGVERFAFLSEGVEGRPAPFARPAAVPRMPWIDRPERGWIAGTVPGPDTMVADGATVKIKRAGFALLARTRTLQADGNGYFGFTNVKPGRYRVWIERDRQTAARTEVRVSAGKVTHAFTASAEP
jgi:uncharacterized lipoprotein YddW (UPF0748 family)